MDDSEISKKDKESVKPSYVGLTRTSVHSRMLAHKANHLSKHSSNPMHRHDLDKHNGNIQEYTCQIIGRERKLIRLYNREALEIENLNEKQRINERQEGGRGGMVRITASRVT